MEMGVKWKQSRVSSNASPMSCVLSSPLISAIPNQVKAAHATERKGNCDQNGNISVPLSCVAFLQLIKSIYLTLERKRPH